MNQSVGRPLSAAVRLRSTYCSVAHEAVLAEHHVVLAAAARCFFSSVLDAVGAQADSAYLSVDPQPRDALTVGRPITSVDGV